MGFTYPGRLATPIEYNEAETGSLALRLALSPHEASPDRVTPPHARSATCQTDNLQGELLSVHKIDQALPGAPGLTGCTGCLFFIFITFLMKVMKNNPPEAEKNRGLE